MIVDISIVGAALLIASSIGLAGFLLVAKPDNLACVRLYMTAVATEQRNELTPIRAQFEPLGAGRGCLPRRIHSSLG